LGSVIGEMAILFGDLHSWSTQRGKQKKAAMDPWHHGRKAGRGKGDNERQ
jgi:hypothetical protein